MIGAGFCYHKSYLSSKSEEDVEYPAYGVTGPAKDCSPAGDRKLAHSAQMYHYQHQKNQMIAINRTNQVNTATLRKIFTKFAKIFTNFRVTA